MNENEPIKIQSDGIIFLSTGRYYDNFNDWVCHKIKELDSQAINYAAKHMAEIIPTQRSVLVPVPGHTGTSTNALHLARAIASYTGLPVADVLVGKDRESQYLAKHAGRPITEEQMGFRQVCPLPSNRLPVIIDAVTDTGTTAKAAYHALGNRGVVLSFAMSDTLLGVKDIYSLLSL